MKRHWFQPFGLFYYPTSWQGILIVILAIAFCVNIFFVIDHTSHSASDTLYGVFPFWLPTFLAVNWIALKTSNK